MARKDKVNTADKLKHIVGLYDDMVKKFCEIHNYGKNTYNQIHDGYHVSLYFGEDNVKLKVIEPCDECEDYQYTYAIEFEEFFDPDWRSKKDIAKMKAEKEKAEKIAEADERRKEKEISEITKRYRELVEMGKIRE